MNKRLGLTKFLFVLMVLFTMFVFTGCFEKDPVKTPTLDFATKTFEVTVGDSFEVSPQIGELVGGIVEYSFDKEGIIEAQGTNGFKAVAAGEVKITASLKGYAEIKSEISVTVKEPVAPVIPPKTISEVIAAEDGNHVTTGVVVAISSRSFVIADNAAKILVYKGSNWTADIVLGDKVKVEGATSVFGGAKQFGETATYEKIGTETFTEEAKEVDAIALDEMAAAESFKVEKVKILGTIAVSGNYINLVVEGATAKGSLAYVVNADEVKALDGKYVEVEGYAAYTSSKGAYVNIVVLGVTEKELPKVVVTEVYVGTGVVTSFYAGKEYELDYLVEPEEATGYVFESSDATIATVDQEGKLTCLTSGFVTITLKSTDDETISSEVTIKIIDLVSEISVTGEKQMDLTTTQRLAVTLLPATAVANPIFTSSDENILEVSGQGIVTAKALGTAKIIVTSSDGSEAKAEIEITVTEPVVDAKVTLADPKVESLQHSSIYTYNGIEFVVGYTAFPSLKKAIEVATEKVYVAPGTYTGDVTIDKSNFTILGPNSGVNPNSVTRLEEAVITGKISVAAELENITINGLAFTLGGYVKFANNNKNVEVSYNNVYDTNVEEAWSESRKEVKAVFDFWAVQGSEITNINVVNNKFSNIKQTGVAFARSRNVNVIGNGFYNFTIDAIRCDGGYNYGVWTFDKNTFKNDTQSGTNGIYFQSVSGSEEGKWQEIVITNNTFENIGLANATSSYNCAISVRTYQEKGLKFDVLYNTFKNCVNYLNVRNNGATKDTFSASINYNAFYGVPAGVYHRNIRPGSNDTNASNPPLANMDFNYYADNNGNTISELGDYEAKFLDLASYVGSFDSKEAYEAKMKELLGVEFEMIVNAEWKDLANGTTVDALGFSWVIGTNAFASISEAIATLDSGKVIKVMAGTYSQDLNITVNGITLLGVNSGVNAQYSNRDGEAVISAVINVTKEVENFTVDGFEFTGAGQVKLYENTKNITVRYNVINGTGADGFVRIEGTEFVYNLKFIGNYSNNYKGNRVLHLNKIDGLDASSNYINCASSYDFINTQSVMRGVVVIKDNTYIKANQSFMYVKGTGSIDATIQGNYIENVKNTIIDLRNQVEENATGTYQITNNTFVKSGTGWSPIRLRAAGYTVPGSIKVNIENNKFIESFYNDNGVPQFAENARAGTDPEYVDPFIKIYTVGKNYYEVNNTALTELTDANFTGAANTIDTPYAKVEDMPAYEQAQEIKPTAIQITNKVAELGAYETYQLTFKVSPDDATNKKVGFISSDANVATVSTAGLVSTKAGGDCVITVYSIADSKVLDTMNIKVLPKERIEVRYEGNGVLFGEETLQLTATLYGKTGTLTYESSDATIATVSETGLVTAVKGGQVIITVKGEGLETKVGLTILDKGTELSDILKVLVEGNNGVVLKQVIKYIGSDDGSADFPHDIYGSANDFWFGQNPEIIRNMLPAGRSNCGYEEMKSVEFIVFHDTGSSPSTSTAQANSGWCTNPSNTGTSWHYTIGNDGIYQQLEDNIVGWHAGDGTSWGESVEWFDTGIKYEGERPEVTVGDDGYFYVAGKKSLVKAPEGTKATNTLGVVVVKGENGNYHLPTTWIASGYGKPICARGGGLNGIGIESAVNLGSDVYLTWQMSAKFIAQLLIKHDLAPDRVTFHNNFSNKKCPNTMMTAGLTDMFLEMVYAEYEIAKFFADYQITIVSDNQAIMNNEGRIVEAPEYTTNVSYTVTVTKDGKSESIKLNTLIIGKYN